MLGRPEDEARAVVLEQQRVRLGVGVGQGMARAHGRPYFVAPEAEVAGAGGAVGSTGVGGWITGTLIGGGEPSPLGGSGLTTFVAVPGELCGAASGAAGVVDAAHRRDHRRVVDRHERRSRGGCMSFWKPRICS